MLAGPRTMKWKLDLISIRSPIAPSATRFLISSSCAWNGNANASQSRVSVRRAAASTRSVSGRTPQSGFSHSTGLPASSARMVHSACSALGSGM